MIIATAGKPGDQLIILGIEHANIERMRDGKPMYISKETHPGFPLNDVKLAIIVGESAESMKNELSKFFSVNTVIHKPKT